MFLSHSQLCFLAASLPFSLSLDILLPDSTPIVLQSTQITLHWIPGDPKFFNLGAHWAQGEMTKLLPDGHSDVPICQAVTNFTQDQNVTVTFNHTVDTDVEDHIMKAWVVGPYHSLAYSHWFAVDGSNTTDTGSGDGIALTPAGSDGQSPTSAATEKATPAGTPAQTKTTSRTGAIVGGVLGSLAFLSIISGLVLLAQRRRRRARNSAPSRAFWKYLDEKRPLRSEPLRCPSPTYSPGVQARPLSLIREDYYHRTK